MRAGAADGHGPFNHHQQAKAVGEYQQPPVELASKGPRGRASSGVDRSQEPPVGSSPVGSRPVKPDLEGCPPEGNLPFGQRTDSIRVRPASDEEGYSTKLVAKGRPDQAKRARRRQATRPSAEMSWRGRLETNQPPQSSDTNRLHSRPRTGDRRPGRLGDSRVPGIPPPNARDPRGTGYQFTPRRADVQAIPFRPTGRTGP